MHATQCKGAVAPGLAAPELAHLCRADLAPLDATAAPPAGLSTHNKDNAAELGSEGGAEGQAEANNADCAEYQRAKQPDDPDTKREATLRARLALAGWVMQSQPNGAHIVTRWGMVRHCTLLDAVAAFAQQVGVKS